MLAHCTPIQYLLEVSRLKKHEFVKSSMLKLKKKRKCLSTYASSWPDEMFHCLHSFMSLVIASCSYHSQGKYFLYTEHITFLLYRWLATSSVHLASSWYMLNSTNSIEMQFCWSLNEEAWLFTNSSFLALVSFGNLSLSSEIEKKT